MCIVVCIPGSVEITCLASCVSYILRSPLLPPQAIRPSQLETRNAPPSNSSRFRPSRSAWGNFQRCSPTRPVFLISVVLLPFLTPENTLTRLLILIRLLHPAGRDARSQALRRRIQFSLDVLRSPLPYPSRGSDPA